ncbi:7TM diverse intracellular signaling domain-containing protein [Leptospira sp. GIMC2001]|uniref:7TM diverse intracellular signaling domain-containing protein n=1 Tax=Leptospira sp. GIMC2001 TaxID=1513297 RepID=UPI002348FFAB|nr:7TM diverse intracellular signaling domain-containing protein [Leptospira sp. GIMC2001]WCL49170.1 hypothetical protein O4O04_18040 [Leptospira sp. GIMC2001]
MSRSFSLSFSLFFYLFIGIFPIHNLFSESVKSNLLNNIEVDGESINPDFIFLEDKTAKLGYEEIKSLKTSNEFRISPSKSPNFGYTNSRYWIHFDLYNSLDRNENLILEITSILDYIDLYYEKDGELIHKQAGKWKEVESRDLIHRNFLFYIPMDASESLSIFMSFESEGAMLLPITIHTQNSFILKDHKEQYLYGIYFGIMFVMVFYNLFLYLSVKDVSYIYYVFYITCFGFFQAGMWGFGHEIFWSWNLWWAAHSLPFFVASASLFASLFAASFLQLKSRSPRFFKIFIGIESIAFGLMIYSILGKYLLAIQLSIFLGVFTSVLLIGTGIYSWKKGYRAARFFVFAWMMLVLGVVAIGFRNFGLLPYIPIINISPQIGSALEVILLSFALADRINILKREKEALQKNALELQKRMTDSFARFVPVEFIRYLGKTDLVSVELGDASEKTMTVLFSDIRSFTSISELMTPEENFRFLNGYLSRVGPTIRRERGFIDKYIGDSIMALFPENPDDAIRASLDIFRELNDYNIWMQEKNQQPIAIGTALHTGNLIIGTIGETLRMDTTVISDAVNLTSRLESLTRDYGVPMIISSDTLNALNENIWTMRSLGITRVKGKMEPIRIYEVIDAEKSELKSQKLEYLNQFNNALEHFNNKEYEKSYELFSVIATKVPNDKPAILFAEKSKVAIKN